MNRQIILPNGIPMLFPNPRGMLKLAATNVGFGKYKDDQGKDQKGWTAVLSMMIGDKREILKAFHIYPGKAVEFDVYAVKVLRIESGRMGMVVMAEVELVE